MNWIIIHGGGRGSRLGKKTNKIFLKIKKRSVIYWTIKKAQECECIDKIIVSVTKNKFKIIKNFGFDKVETTVEPANSRQETTAKIISRLKAKDNDLIGIHNAANPLVSNKELIEVYKAAKKYKSALLAIKVVDTIKISDDKNLTILSPLKSVCWGAQTPQVIEFGLLKKAFDKAKQDKFEGSDESQLVQNFGIKSKIVECSRNNFKITYLEDLYRAKKIL
jgi:2-C-methyl-D-erythritol 4-phosphate cytidylyltransferase